MFEAFLANTSTQGLAPLGTAPQRSYELITGTVRDALGDNHAALFAEPVATQYGDRFDWYAPAAGQPRPLAALDDDSRAAAETRLAELTSAVAELGQSLLDTSDPDRQRLGEALVNATRYPGTDSVYVLETDSGLQPVLLNWAWVSDTQAVVTGDLSGTQTAPRTAKAATAAAATASTAAASATPAAAAAPSAAAAPARLNLWWLMWLGWLLLLLIFAAILFLMVEACALRLPGLPGACPAPGPQAATGPRDTLVLRDRIATLERQIAIADRACQPTQQAALPELPDLPAPQPNADADSARLAARGAREGQLTISLLWDSVADLHLDVRCPSNRVINFDNQRGCGGQLDVGGNHDIRSAQTDAIESMYFDAPDAGSYSIRVTLFNPHGQAPQQPFRLRIRDGDQTHLHRGIVAARGQGWTITHTVEKAN